VPGFEQAGDVAVAADRDEVDAVEGPRVADRPDEVVRQPHARVAVLLELRDQRVGDGELGDVAGERARHRRARDDHHPGVDRAGEVDRRPPVEQPIERERDLGQDEVGVALPRRERGQPRGHADPPRPVGRVASLGKGPRLRDHRPDGQVVGALPRLGTIAVDEEELVHPVCGGCQQVALEAEQVAVARVEAGDRAAAHLPPQCDGDARHRRPADGLSGMRNREATALRP
jgi:hypothetical protein